MQLEKIKSKNGSLTWPYMALTKKKWDLRAIGLSFLRDQTVEREGGEEKREEEKRKRKKRRGRRRNQAKVWKRTLIMDSMRFGMDLWFCMIIILPKPRVLLGFYLNPIIMESKVDKTLNSIRSS